MNLSTSPAVRVPTRLGSLHVRTIGTGRPTVFWSSMFVDSHTWDALIPLLHDPADPRSFVLVDPPGLGLSQPLERRSSIAEAADAARDLLHGLGIVGPVDWVGNAFGGHVGFELAHDPSVLRSLVAAGSPTEPIPPHLRRQISLLGPLLKLAGPVGPVRKAIIEAMLTDASAADPAVRRVVLDSLTRPSRSSLSLALKSFIVDRVDVNDKLPAFRVPSLFVASDDRGDWSPEEADRAAALAPQSRAITVTGARTLIPLEQPDVLARAIRSFWAKLTAAEIGQ